MEVHLSPYTLKHLVYFAKTAEYGSIAMASQKLDRSPASISKAIANLEASWGVKLFVRHHARGLTPTPHAEKLLCRINAVLKEFDQFTEYAATFAKKTNNTISIGCLTTFTQTIFPSYRKDYEKNHPNVQVQQFELNQNEIVEQLRQSKINVAFTYDLTVPDDLKFLPLLDMPPYAVVSEFHDLAGKFEVSVEELAKHPMILLDLPHTADHVQSLFEQKSTHPKIAERTEDPATRMSLIANNYGYGITSFKPAMTRWLDGNSLKFIPITNPSRILKMGLMVSDGETSSKIVQSFIDHCSEFAKSQ